jgi:hypothetical protein
MFFTITAPILAGLSLAIGLMGVAMGFIVAGIEPQEAREAARAAYIGRKSTGDTITQGIYTILFAVALGTLAEISVALRKRSE